MQNNWLIWQEYVYVFEFHILLYIEVSKSKCKYNVHCVWYGKYQKKIPLSLYSINDHRSDIEQEHTGE